MQGKPLPPFGSSLNQLLLANQLPDNDVYLFIGYEAWQKAHSFKRRSAGILCLPFNISPDTYYWPVNRCDVLIFDTGQCVEKYIDDIAIQLFAADAKIIRYVSPNNRLSIFKKEFTNER